MAKKRVQVYQHAEYPTFLYRRLGNECQSLKVNDPDEHQEILDSDPDEVWVDNPAELNFPPTAPSSLQSAQIAAGRNPNDPDALPMPVSTGIQDIVSNVAVPEVPDVDEDEEPAPQPRVRARAKAKPRAKAAPKPRAKARKRAVA